MSSKNSMFKHLKGDLVSGLIVFLIALPLCLGIAQASGAHPFSGIIAGVIGGVVIGFLSKSQLSVSGPAAGLVAIVLGAIEGLGAFDLFLCAVVVSGFFQLLFGFLKAGSVASYFPSSVIEGMLAGIGLTIIMTQLPEALGTAGADVETTVGTAGESGIAASFIQNLFHKIELGAVIIALAGLAILILWSRPSFKKLSIIPAGLLVVVLGTLLNGLLKSVAPELYLSGAHLVNLHIPQSASDFFTQFQLPNPKGLMNVEVWTTGLIIALVGSIETLLCIEATDKLDPLKRYTPGDAELKAQGVGNILSGLIGGLPITSVIVRSSANINAGAKSKLSAIVHGLLLLLCVAAIPFILNLIPKATLAAILIYTGYRLCRPAIFKHMWHAGYDQFIPFVVTAVCVALPFLGLLKGVGIGIVLSVFFILRNNLRMPYFFQRSVYKNMDVVRLELAQDVSFLNKASIKKTLEQIPENSIVVLDATNTEYIDYDVLTLIKDFHSAQAPDKNIKLSLVGFRNTYELPHEDQIIDELKQIEEKDKPVKKFAGKYKKLLKQLNS